MTISEFISSVNELTCAQFFQREQLQASNYHSTFVHVDLIPAREGFSKVLYSLKHDCLWLVILASDYREKTRQSDLHGMHIRL
jgi:hypothetical protein